MIHRVPGLPTITDEEAPRYHGGDRPGKIEVVASKPLSSQYDLTPVMHDDQHGTAVIRRENIIMVDVRGVIRRENVDPAEPAAELATARNVRTLEEALDGADLM
ncbi:MAG: hypothetical protein ACLFUM_11025 [Spirochaetaceae bacterium]